MEDQYHHLGADALLRLAELYETGRTGSIRATIDKKRAYEYYERYVKLRSDSTIQYKLGLDMLAEKNYAKGMTYLEQAALNGEKEACIKLGNIYESGINKYDVYGNKGDYVIPIDLDKAKEWYSIVAKTGDERGIAAFERVEYALNNTDSIEFEEKEKLYKSISARRKSKGVELHFKVMDAAKLQYQYTYVHDEAEGYIHKLPKGWVKTINLETEQEYYAPSHTYKDFAIYVTYDSVPKESTRTIEQFLRYDNDIIDYELNIQDYITEFSDGIYVTYYHKELEKGIVTFAFTQQNRMACLKFVCETMEIIKQYEEVIFEVANSFAFVNPTLASDESANRKDQQYYSEAVFYYFMENYDKAMEFAKKALNFGSKKASYLLIELYFDDESPYKDDQKALAFAQQLYDVNQDSDLAFLIGTIYDQHMKDYESALEWYERAERLEHPRVPFYLGRLYYYGVLKTKRNGQKALNYFRKALENGIGEAQAYIQDIEEIGNQDLEALVGRWEKAIENGDSKVALEVAIRKKDQVFYMANERQIEEAFLLAYELGNVKAIYELGVIYYDREHAEGYNGPIKSTQYLVKAFDSGFSEMESEHLYEVINAKVSEGMSKEEQKRVYRKAAIDGYVPAVDKLIQLTPDLDDDIITVYEELKKSAKAGKEQALSSMRRLEISYNGLILMAVKDTADYKVINNRFFKLSVPKEFTAVINDEGGTIKIADSIVEFAVAEMPVAATAEEDFLKVYKLIVSEYIGEPNAEIVVVNSRMMGSAMLRTKGSEYSYRILLVSAKNQYLFKLSSKDRAQIIEFKERVMDIAQSLLETGEIYIAPDAATKSRKNIGISKLLSSNEDGILSVSKNED